MSNKNYQNIIKRINDIRKELGLSDSDGSDIIQPQNGRVVFEKSKYEIRNIVNNISSNTSGMGNTVYDIKNKINRIHQSTISGSVLTDDMIIEQIMKYDNMSISNQYFRKSEIRSNRIRVPYNFSGTPIEMKFQANGYKGSSPSNGRVLVTLSNTGSYRKIKLLLHESNSGAQNFNYVVNLSPMLLLKLHKGITFSKNGTSKTITTPHVNIDRNNNATVIKKESGGYYNWRDTNYFDILQSNRNGYFYIDIEESGGNWYNKFIYNNLYNDFEIKVSTTYLH